MSFKILERSVLNASRFIFQNRKLKMDDIQEWSSSEDEVRGNLRADEVMEPVGSGIFVAIKKTNDKRKERK